MRTSIVGLDQGQREAEAPIEDLGRYPNRELAACTPTWEVCHVQTCVSCGDYRLCRVRVVGRTQIDECLVCGYKSTTNYDDLLRRCRQIAHKSSLEQRKRAFPRTKGQIGKSRRSIRKLLTLLTAFVLTLVLDGFFPNVNPLMWATSILSGYGLYLFVLKALGQYSMLEFLARYVEHRFARG